MCQHTSSSDLTGCIQGGIGDAGLGMSGGLTNITITGNRIHDTQTGIFYGTNAGDSGIVISNNTISRVNWGIGVGPSGVSLSLTITDNDLSCVVNALCNWDSNGDSNFHHNGIMIYPINSGDKVEGVVISNNFIHDINGETTAGIFLDPTNGDIPGIIIFNNVFNTVGTGTNFGPSNGWIEFGQGGSSVSPTNGQVYNNTIVGGSAGIIGMNATNMRNNVVVNSFSGERLYAGFNSIVSDFNDFFNVTGGGFAAMVGGGTDYATVAAWVTGTGLDTHSITTNPNVTSAFTLGNGSPAIGAGTNLSSLGITGLNTGAPQTFGVNGNCGNRCVARPTSGPWDMGAYPSGSSVSNQPNPPTDLSAQVE
jgi:hypothetical protein